MNAAHDTLPHNANLHLWRKKERNKCLLCNHGSQNLVHVLNLSKAALDIRYFNQLHDGVQARIVESARKNVVSDVHVIADLKDGYNFPPHMVCTNLHPDMVRWNDATRSSTL